MSAKPPVFRGSWPSAAETLPITARGGGSDTSGAAIGSGIILVFTAHMNRILALDPKKQLVIVEPGITYDSLQQTLYTHGYFLPPYPASRPTPLGRRPSQQCRLARSQSNTATWPITLSNLRVVLANGEVIETGPWANANLTRNSA